jgi:tetratricopeptide (TPR) repeat protein
LPLPLASSYFELAVQYDEEGDDRAEEYYVKSLQAGQFVEDCLCNLGILLTRQGQTSKAVDSFSRCLAINSRHLEAHYNLANLYSDHGNQELAVLHYEMAIEIDPSYPNSYYNLALIFVSKKEYKSAIYYINRFISISPHSEQRTARELLSNLITISR